MNCLHALALIRVMNYFARIIIVGHQSKNWFQKAVFIICICKMNTFIHKCTLSESSFTRDTQVHVPDRAIYMYMYREK